MKFLLYPITLAVLSLSAQINAVAEGQIQPAPAALTIAQSSPAGKEGAGQYTSDNAALQRAQERLAADEARLKADKASGKLAAESEVEPDRSALGEHHNRGGSLCDSQRRPANHEQCEHPHHSASSAAVHYRVFNRKKLS